MQLSENFKSKNYKQLNNIDIFNDILLIPTRTTPTKKFYTFTFIIYLNFFIISIQNIYLSVC